MSPSPSFPCVGLLHNYSIQTRKLTVVHCVCRVLCHFTTLLPLKSRCRTVLSQRSHLRNTCILTCHRNLRNSCCSPLSDLWVIRICCSLFWGTSVRRGSPSSFFNLLRKLTKVKGKYLLLVEF